MAERKVLGTDHLLFLDLAGGEDYDLVVCLEENSFSAAVDTIDSKTKCGADKAAGTPSFDVAFSGQVVYDAATGRVSSAALYTALVNKTTVGWKLSKATSVDYDVVRYGTAFINKLEETSPLEGNMKFSAALGIYGTPSQTIVVVPAAPTNGVVDDTDNEFGYTLSSGVTLANHEMSIDGGANWTAATNPVVLGPGTILVGYIQVRVKAMNGNPASAILSNATAFS